MSVPKRFRKAARTALMGLVGLVAEELTRNAIGPAVPGLMRGVGSVGNRFLGFSVPAWVLIPALLPSAVFGALWIRARSEVDDLLGGSVPRGHHDQVKGRLEELRALDGESLDRHRHAYIELRGQIERLEAHLATTGEELKLYRDDVGPHSGRARELIATVKFCKAQRNSVSEFGSGLIRRAESSSLDFLEAAISGSGGMSPEQALATFEAGESGAGIPGRGRQRRMVYQAGVLMKCCREAWHQLVISTLPTFLLEGIAEEPHRPLLTSSEVWNDWTRAWEEKYIHRGADEGPL